MTVGTTIEKIKKRNGAIVEFDRVRIERAIEKACNANGFGGAVGRIPPITDDVVATLATQFGETIPSVEDVQDMVERKLAEHGLWEVAKAYIVYRNERTKEREKEKLETLHKIEERQLTVRKRDGSVVPFDPKIIEDALYHYSRDYGDAVDRAGIVRDTVLSVFDGISSRDIWKALVMAVRSRIEQDPVYSQLAARVLWNWLYEDVLGVDERAPEFAQRYRDGLETSIRRAVQANRLDPRMLAFDMSRLSGAISPERDLLFAYLGAHTVYDRYFIRDLAGTILEAPQYFWMRVAMGLALNEPDKEGAAIRFYNVMSTLRYVPSTPTLFHSGTPHPQLSSCYLTTVADSLDHIFKCIGDNAQLSKWSGGLGNDWTNLRATGAKIKATGVESQGVIPFLKIANDTTAAINRSGRRRGATCAYLETWHYDIEDFLELRKNTGDERRRTHDMNTANWIPDLFMKRVRDDASWTLISPDEAPDLHHLYGRAFEERYASYEAQAAAGNLHLARTVRARDLWKKMLSMLFETGHPWMTWKDPCNLRSPQDHAGVIHSSNLCTEITLNTSAEETAVCNLGSVNLAVHIVGGRLDTELIRDTVGTAVRMLDNVIDICFYPTTEARAANLRHRPVGLGIMGFQDALYQLEIDFASEECVRFADVSMEVISYHAILASSELARERGAYPSYRGSKWDRGIFPIDTLDLLERERGIPIPVPRTATMDWAPVRANVRANGMRNSNVMAMAPTATISNIVGSLPTIEPIYKNLYVKSNQFGDFVVVNRYLIEDLKKLNLWDERMVNLLKYHDGNVAEIGEIPPLLREKYKETFQIEPYWLVKAAAYRGKWIDQSQSLNIFYAGSSGKDLNDIYLKAWEMGLKTTYYLRTLAASQVEKATVNTAQFGSTHKRPAMTAAVKAVAAVAAVEAAQREASTLPAPVTPTVKQSAPSPAPEPPAPPPPPAPPTANVSVQASSSPQLKGLCRIDDPNCEACQ